MKIKVGKKEYEVEVAKTDKELEEGLSNRDSLDKDKGMLFVFDKPQTVGFWMKDTHFDLDICFIDEDEEVISIYHGKAENEDIAEEDNVKYVLEVNANSGIKEGDEIEGIEEDEGKEQLKMQVIAPDGSTQMELEGGERIFSRKNTKTLIRMAKRADRTKSDSDYKKLGNKIFKYIKEQDEREPEYVEKKD